jgi:hypothetical protein
MRIEKFEKFSSNNALLIVDVQKNFRKFFTELYLSELKKYCNSFEEVYQIFDNHKYSTPKETKYLFDNNPTIPVDFEFYNFPNQKDIIEKRYNYKVDSNFYKKLLDEQTYNEISNLEKNNFLKKGQYFPTTEGTIIVFIGNNHRWFHCPKKLFRILNTLKDKKVTIVGGSDSECLDDIFTTAESLGVKIKRNYKYIWSANHCPIK